MPAKPWIVRPLVLSYGDTNYQVEPISYDDGLTLIAVMRGESTDIPNNAKNEDLFKLVMGGTWDTMRSARLPFPVMFRAGMAATQYQMALINDQPSEDAVKAGAAMWESGISPEALAAAMAAVQKTSKASKRSQSTASGIGTRRPGSTTSMTSRKATPPRAAKATRAHRSGRTSSNGTT